MKKTTNLQAAQLKALGHPVRRLKRVQFGPLRLGGLAPGGHRALTRAELAALNDLRGG